MRGVVLLPEMGPLLFSKRYCLCVYSYWYGAAGAGKTLQSMQGFTSFIDRS